MPEMSALRLKHVPERSCVACRTKRPKRELVRVVRSPEGAVKADPGGRANGRGAYLCPKRECWVEGLSKGKLKIALGVTVPDQARRELIEYAELTFGGGAGLSAPAAPRGIERD
jgi:predicted RNA-binding protein YlxR (DUF448 family)